MAMVIPKQLPRIRCAICDKPVDEVIEMYDDFSGEWRLKVRCHGDTDYMAVPLFKMTTQQIDQMKGQEGVAFSVGRINSDKDGGAA